MLQARPLFDNVADARFFVAPVVWPTVRRALERKLNVMVTGARGAGKTTLLHQLQAQARADGQRVAFVDATGAESADELVRRLRDALRGQSSPPVGAFSTLGETVLPNPTPIAGASRALEADLRAIEATEPTTMLVDASGAGSAAYDVFGRLRDTLWQFEHLWVVAIGDHDRAQALKPPADAFFDIVVNLAPLSKGELERVLSLRSPETPVGTLRHVAANANGNPRRALRALSDAVVYDIDPATTLGERVALETNASRIGRPHGMLMTELLERGQASASDSGLQSSLGVGRARLSQLLGELLDRGLVIQDVEASAAPGRPRTVYRPALP